ncbi:MAG: flagellar motor switch protein FliN [Nitrospirota bacterium]
MADEEIQEQSDAGIQEEEAVKTEEKPATFANLDPKSVSSRPPITGNINLLLDVPLKVTVQLGSVKMLIKDLLHLGPGSIIELSKIAGDPMDIFIGEKLIARGEVIVVNETFGVRIIDIVSPEERIQTLNK